MSSTRDRLARRYRRLLRCYPRQYRRARGEEIVATFLDLAPADRTRPTIRETVNLVRHGLRCRLGRPNSRGVVAWAAVTAVAWGLFVGAFATRLAWETARPLPTEAEATQLFSGIRGQDMTGRVAVDPALFVIYGQPLGWHNLHTLSVFDGGEYEQGRAMATDDGPPGVDHRDLVDSTRTRLRANGWSVSDVAIRNRAECVACDESTLPREAQFAARKGDDVLMVEVSLGRRQPLPPKPGVADFDETYFSVELIRATPPAVFPFGAAGVLLGSAFGWFAFGWASRRTEGRSVTLRTVSTALFGIASFMWSAPIILAVPATVYHHLDQPHPSWHPMWEWLGQPALAPMFVIGTGLALLALTVAALPLGSTLAADARSAETR